MFNFKFLMINDSSKEIVEIVHTKIYHIRDANVMIDSDIAELYDVETKRINEAVKNNPDKFPSDFYFELTQEESENLKSKILNYKSRNAA